VNLVPHQRPEAFVDQLMPRQRPLSGKFLGYDQRLEMRIVAAHYFNEGVLESGRDQSFNFRRVHTRRVHVIPTARSVK